MPENFLGRMTFTAKIFYLLLPYLSQEIERGVGRFQPLENPIKETFILLRKYTAQVFSKVTHLFNFSANFI